MESESTASTRRPRINWADVHRKLETSREALLQSAAPAAEERKRILKTRAQALARETYKHGTGPECLDLIVFLLASENYAVELTFVSEVFPLNDLTSLPGAPPFLRGIINVRGRIVCVVDLKKFFDLPENGLTDLNKVIIIGNGQVEFGLLADAVTGMNRIPPETIQPPLPTLTGLRPDYLKGVTVDRLVILDAMKILADPRLVIRGTPQT